MKEERREEVSETITPTDWFERATAQTLHRVVPVAQKDSKSGTTFAISVLELYGDGYGLLRYLASYETLGGDRYEGSPEPEALIRNESGHPLEAQLVAYNAALGEAQGLLQVVGLPDSGELEIKIARLHFRDFRGAHTDLVRSPLEGPWTFRFSI